MRALTLVEMLGALAVLATLIVVVLEITMAYHRRLSRDLENDALEKIGEALRRSVVGDLLVPGSSNFASQVARYGDLAVLDVLRNAHGNPRLLLIDPGITNCGWDVPFSQSAQPLAGSGTNHLRNLRFLLVSSVGQAFTNGLPAAPGGKPTASLFSNLWATPPGAAPAGISWQGDPKDLCFQRIQLLDLFHPVALNHAELSGSQTNGKIRLPGLAVFTAPQGAPHPVLLWLLEGTTLTLSNAADGSLQSEIIRQPSSFTYEKGWWLRGVQGLTSPSLKPSRISGADFEKAVERFIAGSPNGAGNNPGATASAIKAVNAISNYVLWGAQGPASANLTKMGVAQTAMRSAFLEYTDLPPGQFNKP